MASLDDRAPSARALFIAMTVIPFVAVALRLWSRAVVLGNETSPRARFWWDDWTAVLDIPFVVAENAVGIQWTTIGLGKHITQVNKEDIVTGLKLLYANYPLYDLAIALPKISALFFYARIFSARNNKTLRIALWTTGWIIVAWIIFVLFSAFFQCTPVKKAWLPTIPGHCLDTWQWWLASAISSATIDLIILLIPMPILWKLQLKPLKKFLIFWIFVCGYCVIIVSIGRLVAVYKAGPALDEDLTYNVVPITYWLSLEAPISLVSICLPAIFSFVKRGIESGPYSLLTSKNASSLRMSDDRNNRTPNYAQYRMDSQSTGTSAAQLYNQNAIDYSVKAFKVPSLPTSIRSADPESYAMDAIRVRKDVDVENQQWVV